MAVNFETSPATAQLRAALLLQCDLPAAAAHAERITNLVVDSLNEKDLDVATHLVAGALIARGLISCGADWWSRAERAPPLPDTYAALLDVVLNLPAELDGETYDVREGRPG